MHPPSYAAACTSLVTLSSPYLQWRPSATRRVFGASCDSSSRIWSCGSHGRRLRRDGWPYSPKQVSVSFFRGKASGPRGSESGQGRAPFLSYSHQPTFLLSFPFPSCSWEILLYLQKAAHSVFTSGGSPGDQIGKWCSPRWHWHWQTDQFPTAICYPHVIGLINVPISSQNRGVEAYLGE